MRRRTRNAVLAVLGVVVLLLALGALPSYLKSGDPYYVVADPGGDDPALNASAISTQRFPYVTDAIADAAGDRPGRSAPYWKGPVGFKEAFTHSPFEEFDALTARQPNATRDGDIVVVADGTHYRLSIIQEAES